MFLNSGTRRQGSWHRGNTSRRHSPWRRAVGTDPTKHPRWRDMAGRSAPRSVAPTSLPLNCVLFPFPSVAPLFILSSRFFSPPQLAQPSDSSYLTVKTSILSVDRQEQGILSHLLNSCVLIWSIVRAFSKFRNLGFRV